MGMAISASILSATFLVSIMLFNTAFTANTTMTGMANRETAQVTIDRKNTSIEITDVRVSQSGTCVAVDVENSGSTRLGSFSDMDALADYPTSGGSRVTKRFTWIAVAGTDCTNLGADHWTVTGISPDPTNAGLWDPNETATLEFKVSVGIAQSELGVLSIATENAQTSQAFWGW